MLMASNDNIHSDDETQVSYSGEEIEAPDSSIQERPKKNRKTFIHTGASLFKDVPDGTLLEVEVDRLGKFVGNNAKTIERFIGLVARDPKHFCLTKSDWEDVGQQIKDKMVQEIEMKFKIAEVHKPIILASMSEKWRAHRTKLKAKYFTPFSKEERMTIQPDPIYGIKESDWKALVEYFENSKVEEISRRNKENRLKRRGIMHRLGSKSFNQLGYEMEQKMGRKPNKAEKWSVAYKRDEGQAGYEEYSILKKKLEEAFLEYEIRGLLPPQGASPNDLVARVFGPERRGSFCDMCKREGKRKLNRGSSSTSNEAQKLEELQEQFNILRETTRDEIKQKDEQLKAQADHLQVLLQAQGELIKKFNALYEAQQEQLAHLKTTICKEEVLQ